jgi:hypothetical protein
MRAALRANYRLVDDANGFVFILVSQKAAAAAEGNNGDAPTGLAEVAGGQGRGRMESGDS